MTFIRQCKGKDLSNVPESKLIQAGWYGSIKYDGNYVQIHKQGTEVRFFTSGGKEFYLPKIAHKVSKLQVDSIVLECEFFYDCRGKLGDRVTASKITTYRTAFRKGITVTETGLERFMVFDYIPNESLEYHTAYIRLGHLGVIGLERSVGTVQLVQHTRGDLEYFKNMAKSLREEKNWEGVFLVHSTHLNISGKRTNLAIKLKYRPTADLRCVGVSDGEGKYLGMIGALELLDEDRGLRVSVGTGLNDVDRSRDPSHYIGKVVEIEYEQIMDTYIQPVFKFIREDKE